MGDDVSRYTDENARRLGELILRAWTDEDYLQRLRDDPAAALDEGGVAVAPGVRVELHEDSDEVKHLVIPAKPSELEVTDARDSASTWCWCL
jgi:hypothetical protein